ARIRSGDHGHDWLSITQIEHFMRHTRFDVDEVTGLVVHHLLEPGTVLVADAPLKDVQHDIETDMDMSAGYAAGRNGGHVHRQLLRADILGRHSELVFNAVPLSAVGAAANRENTIATFHPA